jgi:hypothetical protein
VSAIVMTRPSVPSIWARMVRSGSGRVAVLADRVLFGSHRPPPPDCDGQLPDDPETQLMIALICSMQI